MQDTTQFKPRLLLLLSALIAGTFFIHLATYGLTADQFFFAEDQVLTLVISKLILKGEFPLVGAPSHIGGRHLGAISYYIASLATALSNGNDYYACLYTALSSLVFVVTVLILVASLYEGKYRLWGLAAAALSIVASDMVTVARIQWYNHIALIPVSIFLLVLLNVFQSGPRFLPLLFLFGSLSIQAHFMTGPLMVTGTACGILYCMISRKVHDAPNRFLLTGRCLNCLWLLLCGLSWIPLFFYEYEYGDVFTWFGNVNVVQSENVRAGIQASIHNTLYLFRSFTFGQLPLDPYQRIIIGEILIGIVLFFAYVGTKKMSMPIQIYCGTLFLAVVVYTVLLSRERPPLHMYYVYSLIPVPILCISLATVGILSLTGDRTDLVRIVSGGCIGSCLCISFFLRIKSVHETKVFPPLTIAHANEIAAVIKSKQHDGDVAYVKGIEQSAIMEDAIYYALGEEYWNRIHYHEVFKELPTMAHTVPLPTNGYLLACPWARKETLERVKGDMAHEWSVKERIDLSTTNTGTHCQLFSLEHVD